MKSEEHFLFKFLIKNYLDKTQIVSESFKKKLDIDHINEHFERVYRSHLVVDGKWFYGGHQTHFNTI